MCAYFDDVWKIVLAILLFFSILTLLLRVRYSARISTGNASGQPQWLASLVFWGSGIVGITMLASMILAFVCTGSPGDIKSIIPN